MLMRASPQRPTWSRDTARFFDEGDAATNQGPGQSPPLNGPRSITPGAAGVRTVRPYGSGTSGVRPLKAAVLFYGCRPVRDSFAAVKPGVSKSPTHLNLRAPRAGLVAGGRKSNSGCLGTAMLMTGTCRPSRN